MNGTWRVNGHTWLPEEAEQLKLNLIVKAHCGSSGNRGKDATESEFSLENTWNGMTKDVEQFIQIYLHCIISRTGERVPRPLTIVLHAQNPTEVVHLHFLYMGNTEESRLKYVLVVKADVSSYTKIHAYEVPGRESAGACLNQCISSFGGIKCLVTDCGPYFTAFLFQNVTGEVHILLHYPTAYCPWANARLNVCGKKYYAREKHCCPNGSYPLRRGHKYWNVCKQALIKHHWSAMVKA